MWMYKLPKEKKAKNFAYVFFTSLKGKTRPLCRRTGTGKVHITLTKKKNNKLSNMSTTCIIKRCKNFLFFFFFEKHCIFYLHICLAQGFIESLHAEHTAGCINKISM